MLEETISKKNFFEETAELCSKARRRKSSPYLFAKADLSDPSDARPLHLYLAPQLISYKKHKVMNLSNKWKEKRSLFIATMCCSSLRFLYCGGRSFGSWTIFFAALILAYFLRSASLRILGEYNDSQRSKHFYSMSKRRG